MSRSHWLVNKEGSDQNMMRFWRKTRKFLQNRQPQNCECVDQQGALLSREAL